MSELDRRDKGTETGDLAEELGIEDLHVEGNAALTLPD